MDKLIKSLSKYDEDKKKIDMGRVIFETYFPDRDPEGLELASEKEIEEHPEMSDAEKKALANYIQKVIEGDL